MKKLLLLAVTLLLIASVANAQLPPEGYIGLFTDDTHSVWCVDGVGMYPVEMWIMCLPNFLGQMCAEFCIGYPPNVIQSTITQNVAVVSVALGTLPGGMSVCYQACQWDWHWNFHQQLWVTTADETYVEILVHPDTGELSFANCEPGYPMEPAIPLTKLYLNLDPLTDPPCLTGTEDASWGAIKSMID
jgi:hypothetical protein